MPSFTPSPDVAAILNALLDIHERRELGVREDTARRQTIRVALDATFTPDYFSQTDPAPRQIANAQLQTLGQLGVLRLEWLRGEQGHLLAAVALEAAQAEQAYAAVGRASLASKRKTLLSLLLAERARFNALAEPQREPDWRIRALSSVIHHLREGKAPAPFSVNNTGLNEDVLAALRAVNEVARSGEETPLRVFSVRVFNDSKRFEQIAPKLATLARRGNPHWRTFTRDEILRELNLVANPNHLFLAGDWELIDAHGQMISLGGFAPSVGVPAAQAARLKSVRANASRVICIENLTSFYEWVRREQTLAASSNDEAACVLCLMGNPSPACRHLLRCLPADTPLFVWADMDYGGFNILAQVRAQVNANAQPLWMDADTFERHARLAKPLLPGDIKRLTRLLQHPLLGDVGAAIAHLLARGLKLEQEAIGQGERQASVPLP